MKLFDPKIGHLDTLNECPNYYKPGFTGSMIRSAHGRLFGPFVNEVNYLAYRGYHIRLIIWSLLDTH